MFNPNWPLWIESSVIRHCVLKLAAANIAYRTALEDVPPPSDQYVQVVLDGPEIQNPSGDCYICDITVTLLIEFKVKDNIYDTARAVGVCMAMLESIPVYSDQGQIGCLIPVGAPQSRDWGSRDNGVASKKDIHQRTVECTLEMDLK